MKFFRWRRPEPESRPGPESTPTPDPKAEPAKQPSSDTELLAERYGAERRRMEILFTNLAEAEDETKLTRAQQALIFLKSNRLKEAETVQCSTVDYIRASDRDGLSYEDMLQELETVTGLLEDA